MHEKSNVVNMWVIKMIVYVLCDRSPVLNISDNNNAYGIDYLVAPLQHVLHKIYVMCTGALYVYASHTHMDTSESSSKAQSSLHFADFCLKTNFNL